MLVFVLLPCSTKRNIKLALKVPMAHVEHGAKTNKKLVCATSTKATDERVLLRGAQNDLLKQDFILGNAALFIAANEPIVLAEVGKSVATTVPRYVLYQQYLI